MAKGDIVLVTFPFTDLSGSKLRPAVIIVDTPTEVTACFVTTQIHWREPTDVLVTPSTTNSLRAVSLVRIGKICTLDRILVKGLMGRLTSAELSDLDAKLKILLQLT